MSVTKRPPVVVVLGHVDHGKTTLLDTIRKTSVADKEEGGITQSIGAYEIEVNNKNYDVTRITFIDTPGHELFGKLRERGAKVADMALLLIDCSDGIKPQTIESIAHIKTANIPYIVVLNKIDLPDVKPDILKKQLLKHEVAIEGFGGEVPCALVSAKTGKGIDELLETILLVWSFKQEIFDRNKPVEGYIIESSMTKGGPSGTAIIKNGTLRVGDVVYIDNEEVKVRGLLDQNEKPIRIVQPCAPCVLIGSKKLPAVGAKISHVLNIKNQKEKILIDIDPNKQTVTTDESTNVKQLMIILKADTNGSLEAIMPVLNTNDRIRIVTCGVGAVTDTDVYMAKISKAVIISFRAGVGKSTMSLAEAEKVVIKTYSIIYELLDELQEVADLLYEKQHKEKMIRGEAVVQALFTIEDKKIAGVKCTKGKILLGDQIDLFRGAKLSGMSKILSMKSRARAIKELKKGEEGGLFFDSPLDVRVGDVIKSYSI